MADDGARRAVVDEIPSRKGVREAQQRLEGFARQRRAEERGGDWGEARAAGRSPRIADDGVQAAGTGMSRAVPKARRPAAWPGRDPHRRGVPVRNRRRARRPFPRGLAAPRPRRGPRRAPRIPRACGMGRSLSSVSGLTRRCRGVTSPVSGARHRRRRGRPGRCRPLHGHPRRPRPRTAGPPDHAHRRLEDDLAAVSLDLRVREHGRAVRRRRRAADTRASRPRGSCSGSDRRSRKRSPRRRLCRARG